ncbi:MAG TPA: M23 family metallopeptidase [Gammaproteobacteria bacterium]|nr:M23 family metallopeptidase [Gammaproteobacteria bacterium]
MKCVPLLSRSQLHKSAGWLLTAVLLLLSTPLQALVLRGQLQQGGMVIGQTRAGVRIDLDGQPVRVNKDGHFVIGFGRSHPATALLTLRYPDGRLLKKRLVIVQRNYAIQRINGLPEKKVSPPPALAKRIHAEALQVKAARAYNTDLPWFFKPFIWPVTGPITGVYGSQRILNGKPRWPHYGVDVAAPMGTVVHAVAAGIVRLAHPGMYLSGATLVIDHGFGVSSSYLHLSKILVHVGQRVRQGQAVAKVGSSGRVTGPHLDWRINWFKTRLDAALVAGPMPDTKTAN